MAIIYHNPRCGTSRTVLQILRDRGIEPTIVLYLETPLSASELGGLAARSGSSVRDFVRSKEALYTEMGLDAPKLSDAQLLQAMAEHPVLMNRPIVVTDKGVRLCRPASVVEEIL